MLILINESPLKGGVVIFSSNLLEICRFCTFVKLTTKGKSEKVYSDAVYMFSTNREGSRCLKNNCLKIKFCFIGTGGAHLGSQRVVIIITKML